MKIMVLSKPTPVSRVKGSLVYWNPRSIRF